MKYSQPFKNADKVRYIARERCSSVTHKSQIYASDAPKLFLTNREMSEVRHDTGESKIITEHQEISKIVKRYHNVSS